MILDLITNEGLDYGDMISSLAIILTGITLFISLYQKFKLDKKNYAINLVHTWNDDASEDIGNIRFYYSDNYEHCKKIDNEEVQKIYLSDLSKKDKNKDSTKDEIDYYKVKESIRRLFNYFEYISSTYTHNAADRKIIRDSFAQSMMRYYKILENYLLLELLDTGRNPWKPFTQFIEKEVNIKKVFCAACQNEDYCIMKKTELKQKRLQEEEWTKKYLSFLNIGKLGPKEIIELSKICNYENEKIKHLKEDLKNK